MSLYLSNNKLFSHLLWLIVIAILLILFFTSFPINSYSVSERLTIAEKNVILWQLLQAENILEPLAVDNKTNLQFVNTYLNILLKEGKIKLAKHYLININDVKIINDSRFLLNTSQIYYFYGLPDSAKIFAKKAIAISETTNNKRVESKANNVIGLIDFYLAHYDSALTYQYKALKIAKNNKLKNEQADALRQIGVIYWYRGKLDSALNSYYLPALKLYREVNDKIGEAITLNNIGLIYFDKKDWFREYPYHLQAYKIQIEINDLLGLADTYYFLAYIPIFNKEMLNYQYEFLTKSYNLSVRIGYQWGKIVSGNKIISFVLKNSSIYASTPIKINSDEDNTGEGKIISAISKLNISETEKDYEKIISLSKKIYSLSDSLGYEVYKFWSLYRMSFALFNQGKTKEAKKNILQSKKLTYTKTGRKYYPIDIDLLLSRIYSKENNINKAINLLKIRAAEYDSIYSINVNKPQSIQNYESAVVSVYLYRSIIYSLLLDILYKAGKTSEFFRYSERRRLLPFWGKYNNDNTDGLSFSKLLMEFQNVDINSGKRTFSILEKLGKMLKYKNSKSNVVKSFYNNTENTYTISIDAIQKRLNDKDIFVEYTFGEKYIYAFVIRKHKKKLLFLNSTKEDITLLINFFRKALLRGKVKPGDRLWKGPAKNIYNILVKPIVDIGLLKKGDNFIISPHNSLYLLPFNALITDDKNNLLLFNYNISYVSSSQSINKNRKLKLNSYLGVAPVTKDLEFTQSEIINIPESLFKMKKQLLNSSATKSNFLKLAPHFDVIHIASHININNQSPLYSSIQFTGQPLKIYEIFKTKIKPKLLILSACESGKALGMVNDIPSEIDLVNFSRAFREAGVKNVIATKWLLEDLSAYRIINNFFKIMELNKNSILVEDILTSAQREYLINAKKLGNKTHPYYWAAFYLLK